MTLADSRLGHQVTFRKLVLVLVAPPFFFCCRIFCRIQVQEGVGGDTSYNYDCIDGEA